MKKVASRPTLPEPKRSFDPPEEAQWHRMISEAAYFHAVARNFEPGQELADWLAAEAEVKVSLGS
jgi:hypothetical protein